MNWLRTGVRILRAILLASCAALFFVVASIQIEQHVLRRRAETLLADIRSLQIHRSSLTEVKNLDQKWGRFTHWDNRCGAESCQFVIKWDDFYMRHVTWFYRFHHLFMVAGGRPQSVSAVVLAKNGIFAGENIGVIVGVPGDWAEKHVLDYALIGNARSSTELSTTYRPGPQHPLYIVGRPSGCDGPCKEAYFIFDPSLDPAIVDRFMQFDLSCLTRWIHPCRNERDIMPNAWAQYKIDYPQTSD